MHHLILTLTFICYTLSSWALCTNPTAPAGTLDWKNTKFQFCDGTHWQDFGAGGGTSTLEGLSNVSATSPANRYILQFDGTRWESIDIKHILAELGLNIVDPDDACAAGKTPNIGAICLDGTIYAGLSPDGNTKMYTTRCDLGQTWDGYSCIGQRIRKSWSTGSPASFSTQCKSPYTNTICNTGKTNSAFLFNIFSPRHEATEGCENLSLHGHNDWYLPAINELLVLYNNGNPPGGVLRDNTYYWSSSEYDSTTSNTFIFGSGIRTYQQKPRADSSIAIRCIRR